MWRKTRAESFTFARMGQVAFTVLPIVIAAFFASTVQADCDPRFNCGSCNTDGTCTTCRTGFGHQKSTGYCEACGTDCLECSPIGENCTHCIVGFGPDFQSGNGSCGPCLKEHCQGGCSVYGAGTCDICEDRYGRNPSRTNCTKCVEHCLSCPIKTLECESCEFGYSVFDPGNKSCGACSKYCTIHGCFKKGPGGCIQCDPGYVFFRNTFRCGPCAENCLSCEVNGASQCDNCTFGYGLTATNTCEPCSPHCSKFGCNITGAHKCDMCDFGYGLLPNGSCDRCSNNCTQYGCNTTGAHNCTQCDLGFGLLPDGSCGPCASDCTKHGCTISGAHKCDECDNGFLLYIPTKTCEIITTTYLPTTTQAPTTTTTRLVTTTVAATKPATTVPGSHGSVASASAASAGGDNKYTTIITNTGSGGGGGDGITTASVTTINSNGWNSDSLVSGLPQNTVSTSEPTEDMDWRIVLTFVLLIVGGIFITIVVALCWAMRFHPLGNGRTKRYRRRIDLQKES